MSVFQSLFSVSTGFLDSLQRMYMRIYTLLRPSEIVETIFGTNMNCQSRDFVQRRIRFFKIFEHNLTYYTLARLNEGDGYADIGANVGYYTLLASRKVGNDGFVVSVEADPTTFGKLVDNIRLNPSTNVEAVNAAATAEFCTISIRNNDQENIGTNSIILDEKGQIQGRPLLDLLGERTKRTNFIKIDVEGSERPLLESILGNLSEFPQRLTVAAEVSSGSADLVEEFVNSGFRAYVMEPIYTIDYYLVRHYLAAKGHPPTYSISEVMAFVQGQPDYIFERI